MSLKDSKSESWKQWEGRTVDGKFPLRQWLGGSDGSAVFVTERASQRAAIKLTAANASADQQLAQWRAAAALSHPHLMRMHECGRTRLDTESLLFVVMECADENLAQILPERALTGHEVGEMLPPLLDALSYLHGQGLVHARIKPSNILAVGDQLKLSSDDALRPSESAALVKHRDAFDAPETSSGTISLASDLWALGATLVTALTQNPLQFANAASDPAVPATISEPFRGIARECLRVDPIRRCSIADIQARLQPAARSVPEPHSPEPVPSGGGNRFGLPILIFAVVLVALVAGIKLFQAKPHPAGTESVPTATATPKADPATTESAKTEPAKTESASATKADSAPQTAPPPASTPQLSTPAPSTASSADSKGAVAHEVLPDIPRSAMNTITGTIKISVRVEVDSSGKVTDAKLTKAGPSKYFAGFALNAARGWEFTPPTANGQATASVWTIHFRLRRSGTQASADHSR